MNFGSLKNQPEIEKNSKFGAQRVAELVFWGRPGAAEALELCKDLRFLFGTPVRPWNGGGGLKRAARTPPGLALSYFRCLVREK